MSKTKKTAAQKLADLQDARQWMLENFEDTTFIDAEIEQARIEADIEKIERKEQQ